MAEHRDRSDSSGGATSDLQRLVRTIVTDLISHESNSRMQTTTTQSGNRFSSPEQEVNTIFRIPRGGSQSSTTTSASTSNMNNSQTNVALNFNFRQNYGLSSQPQRKRQVVRQQQIQAPRKRNRGQTSDIHAKYIKDDYLLPDPTWETVPRREKKAFLQTHNFVVDAFEIDKRWDLEELTTQFHQLFSAILDENALELTPSCLSNFI